MKRIVKRRETIVLADIPYKKGRLIFGEETVRRLQSSLRMGSLKKLDVDMLDAILSEVTKIWF